MEYVDQLGRILQLTTTPKRIVSLVPSQTELLVDLGLKTQLVGVTKFCVHPKNIREVSTVVGGTKNVKYSKVEALAPDLIICNKEENTKEMVERLATIAPVWVSDIYTIKDTLAMITSFGKIFNVESATASLLKTITNELEAFKDFIQTYPVKKVFYLIWKKPYMAAGKATFINTLLQLNKFDNVAASLEGRYPEVSVADLKQADLILLSSEPYPFKEEDVKLLQAKLNTKVLLVDGEYFSWYGSRLKNAFTYFKTLH